MVYMLITGERPFLECDQIVETLAIAKREKRDLEKLGCTVRIKAFASWAEAEAYADKLANS